MTVLQYVQDHLRRERCHGTISISALGSYLNVMLSDASGSETPPDLDALRFAASRMPDYELVVMRVRDWIDSRIGDGRALGVAAFFVGRHQEVARRVDVPLLLRLHELTCMCQDVPGICPDAIISAVSVGWILTRDSRLSEIVRSIDTAKGARIQLAIQDHQSALAIMRREG